MLCWNTYMQLTACSQNLQLGGEDWGDWEGEKGKQNNYPAQLKLSFATEVQEYQMSTQFETLLDPIKRCENTFNKA